MITIPVGNAAKVILPFVDHEGNPIEPASLLLTVTDENGNQLAGPLAPAFDPGDTELEYTVAQAINLSSGIRVVDLKITTATGYVNTVSETVVLQARKRLIVPQNSFQTYEMALVTAANMPPLSGWASSDDTLRRNALEEAFLRLIRLGYRVRKPEDLDVQNVIEDETKVTPRSWPVMTIDRWNRLPEHFRNALRKAQVFEADEVLRGDIVGDKRRLGVLSESIGESSMMFRTGKPLDLGISTGALRYLTGYVDMRITITRT